MPPMKLTKRILNRIVNGGIATAEKYALPILVFDAGKETINSATGSIIRTAKGAVLATAGHVIDEFLRLGEAGRMQIGGSGYVLKNVAPGRIVMSKDVDFGLIRLTDDDVAKSRWSALPASSLHFGGVRKMDLVAYVGFPGCWRKVEPAKTMVVGRLFCAGAIETVELDQFSIRIDERRYELEKGQMGPLEEAGGISGAPVFSLFDFNDSRVREPLLVGWIHEGMVWDDLAQKHYAVQASTVSSLFT